MLTNKSLIPVGEPSGADLAWCRRAARDEQARKDPGSVFKYHKHCLMHEWREKTGRFHPEYCQGWFWTNRGTKLTCNEFCSMDLMQSKHARNGRRRKS